MGVLGVHGPIMLVHEAYDNACMYGLLRECLQDVESCG